MMNKNIKSMNKAPMLYWVVCAGLVISGLLVNFLPEHNETEASVSSLSKNCISADGPAPFPGQCLTVTPVSSVALTPSTQALPTASVKPIAKKPYWKTVQGSVALRLLKSPPEHHAGWYSLSSASGKVDTVDLKKISEHYGFPGQLLYFMGFKETQGRCDVISQKGASGCFQFMPDTAKQFGLIRGKVDFRHVRKASADTAARYLAWLLVLFYEDNADPKNWEQLRHALAAYNAGHSNVSRDGKLGIPSFTETLRYVHDIEELTTGRAVVVQWRDTLDKLSARTGVDKSALLRANIDLKDDGSLKANTIVYLPDPQSGLSKVLITRGMTLSQIQRDTGVSMKDLIDANRLKKPDQLSIGQFIYIPVLKPEKPVLTAQVI